MIRSAGLLSLLSLISIAVGQQVGTQTAETHPTLSWQTCTKGGTCTTAAGSVTLDANWRWLHTTTGYTNCYTGNQWDASLCPDPVTCAKNCALDGADYSGTYGITTSGNALTLKFKTGANVGSRVYLMASDSTYQMFKPKNKEFTFDVDLSNLGCGLNGALYFSEMDADGGLAKNAGNKAGAKYGTGYCDSQCPHDLKFINGEANTLNWTASSANAGAGQYGSCCNEFDVWEANSVSTAYTPHGCTVDGLYRCSGTTCGDGSNRYGGVCDKDGCDFNSYRLGQKSFYGKGMTVDTSSKFTVVTQFITADNTTTGALSEVRRLYVQNGKVIQNSKVNVPGLAAYDSVTAPFCAAQKKTFGDTNDFATKGGFTPMSKAFDHGMVLVMSVWDDYAANMLWLDGTYPTGGTAAGSARGTCNPTSGVPATVESVEANDSVTFSNIRFGDIGSTYTGSAATNPSSTAGGSPSSTSTASAPGATASQYGQCGGTGYTGPTVCATPYTCTAVSPPFYYQCM